MMSEIHTKTFQETLSISKTFAVEFFAKFTKIFKKEGRKREREGKDERREWERGRGRKRKWGREKKIRGGKRGRGEKRRVEGIE